MPGRRGRPNAFADVTLPLGLNWSTPGAVYELADRRRRARCYEIVLREGTPADLLRFVDGALLVCRRRSRSAIRPIARQ